MSAIAVVALDEDSFDETIHASSPILVDFRADWCRPCRKLAPLLEELARELAGRATIASVDIDRAGDLANRFGVRALPTLVLFVDGRVVDQLVGAAPIDQIRELIERRLG